MITAKGEATAIFYLPGKAPRGWRCRRDYQVHATGCFALDRYQGEDEMQLRLTDIEPPEPFARR